MGVSSVESMSLERLWIIVVEGHKSCTFTSELAATEATGGRYRVGVGISRLSECLLVAISRLKSPTFAQLLQEAPLNRALAEAQGLEPHLQILAAGKTGTGQYPQKRFVASEGPKASMHSNEAVNAAARALFEWLASDKSAFRSMLSILSAGGAFFSASVMEKTGRAAVVRKPIMADLFCDAAMARANHKGPDNSDEPLDDTGGLF